MGSFGITSDDIKRFKERQAQNGIDNHPLRDTSEMTFFQAMMSDDADFVKMGIVSPDALR